MFPLRSQSANCSQSELSGFFSHHFEEQALVEEMYYCRGIGNILEKSDFLARDREKRTLQGRVGEGDELRGVPEAKKKKKKPEKGTS